MSEPTSRIFAVTYQCACGSQNYRLLDTPAECPRCGSVSSLVCPDPLTATLVLDDPEADKYWAQVVTLAEKNGKVNAASLRQAIKQLSKSPQQP